MCTHHHRRPHQGWQRHPLTLRSSLVGRRRPHQGVRYVPGPEARGGVLAVAAEEEGEVAVPGVLRGDAVEPVSVTAATPTVCGCSDVSVFSCRIDGLHDPSPPPPSAGARSAWNRSMCSVCGQLYCGDCNMKLLKECPTCRAPGSLHTVCRPRSRSGGCRRC